jgi:hypothetical protein
VVEQRLHDAPGLLDAVLPGEVLMVAGERGVQQALVRLRRFAQLADEPGVQVNGAPGLFGQLAVEAGFGAAARVMFSLGDVLGGALVRPGHVVVRLILSQDGVQMSFAEDQHAVEELTAQGADEPLAMASGPSGASSAHAEQPIPERFVHRPPP